MSREALNQQAGRLRGRAVYVVDGTRTPFLKARGRPGPFRASEDAERASMEYSGEGMRTAQRSGQGQIFIGHSVQVTNVLQTTAGRMVFARIDEGGALVVGPVSAGAVPGPNGGYVVIRESNKVG